VIEVGKRERFYLNDECLFIIRKKLDQDPKFNKSGYIQELIKRDNQDKFVSLYYHFDLKIKEANDVFSAIQNQHRINKDLKIKIDEKLSKKLNDLLEKNRVKMKEMKIQVEQQKKLQKLYRKEARKLWKEYLVFVGDSKTSDEYYVKYREFKSGKKEVKEEVWGEFNICWREYWEKQKKEKNGKDKNTKKREKD
jgi:hypothetical protein